MFSEIYFSQKGSVVKETFNVHFLLFLISLIQALTASPFTSISQAPQLPVRQPVGISKPAFSAEENQSSPSETNVSIFLGLPLSIIFDFILLKVFGFNYVLLFSPALTILSVIQVLILREIKFKFSRNILFLKRPEKNNLYKFFDNITFRSFYILIIRSFPVLPHVLGSYIIASSKIKKKVILINTFFGSFFYYVFLYLIIGNV